MTYSLAFGNTGTGEATNVLLTDILPADLSFIVGSATGNNVTYHNGTLTWLLGTLAPGATSTVKFQARVATGAKLYSTISNTAAISSDEISSPVSSTATVTVAPSQRGDWWMFQHDAQHTGRSTVTGPTVPELKWQFAFNGYGNTSAMAFAADGTLYLTSQYEHFCALNPDSSRKWTQNFYGTTPAINSDGTIYVGSGGKLYAINPDGTIKWTFVTNSGSITAPLLDPDGTIYVSCNNGYLYAITPDGTLKLVTSIANNNLSTPALGTDGALYISGADSMALYAFNADGTPKWVFPTDTQVYYAPSVASDGTIYVGSFYHLYAINPDGTLKWKFPISTHIYGTQAVAADGTVYFTTWDGNLYAVDPNGRQKWVIYDWFINEIPPMVGGDGTIYACSGNGRIDAVNPDGTWKWTFPLTNPFMPVLGTDGMLYVGCSSSICVIGNATPSALTAIQSASPTQADPGTVITYTVAYTNTGTNAVSNVRLSDLLPSSTTYVTGSTAAKGTYDATTRTLSWAVGTLAPGETGQVTFQVSIDPYILPGSTIINTASICCSEATTPVASNSSYVVIPVNNPPTIDQLPDQMVPNYARPFSISLTGISAGKGDRFNVLDFSVLSSNTALIPKPAISYDPYNRMSTAILTFQPATGQLGSSTITVTVKDHDGTANGGIDTTEMSFIANVCYVNLSPTINPIGNQIIRANSNAQTITIDGIGSGGSGEEALQDLSVTAKSDNPALIPDPVIRYDSPGMTGSLTYQPLENQFGTATITVTVQDNGGTANGAVDTATVHFTVTVTPPGFEGDISPWPNFDGQVSMTDWVQVGRFVVGLDTPASGSQYQQADCAPVQSKGDGQLTLIDWIQTGRYALGLDPIMLAGGPTAPVTHPQTARSIAMVNARCPRVISLTSSMFSGGRTGTVRVVLDAQGNESALGFTLKFNPRQLKFLGAKLVGAVSNATLNLNTKKAATGCVGLALMLPLPRAIPVGKQPLIELTFQPLTRGAALLSFDDQLVTREVAGVTASNLQANYVNGLVIMR